MGNLTADIEERDDGEHKRAIRPLLSSRTRLLLLAVALPAFVAASSQLLFVAVQNHYLQSAWLYPWMTFTTAVLSWCVGRYLDLPWLRWLIFTWYLALLDIVTIAACLNGPVPSHIGYVLISAQITFVTVLAVLGPWSWQWRLPAVLVAAAAVIVQSGSFMSSWNTYSWNMLMILTAVVVVLLCAGLRLGRFKLRKQSPAATSLTATDALQAHQFGVKHLLIWATAVVPILLVVRGLDGDAFRVLGLGGLFTACLLAASLATVNLLTLWAVLGGGLLVIRLAVLLFVPLLVAVGFNSYSAHLETRYGRWLGPPLINVFIEMREQWISWLCLAAALSAALLLYLRASGFRIMRAKR